MTIKNYLHLLTLVFLFTQCASLKNATSGTFKDKKNGQVIKLGHFSCTYDLTKIALPIIERDCEEKPEVTLTAVNQMEDDGLRPVNRADWTKLAVGSFQLTWAVAKDCHGQTATFNQLVVIKDVTKPSAVAVNRLSISFSNESRKSLTVDDINAGSYDACGIQSIQIRIKGTDQPWANYIDIGCEHLLPDLQIEMRVMDKEGNQDIALTELIIKDEIRPICIAPTDIIVGCDERYNRQLDDYTDTDGDRKFEDSEWRNVDATLQKKLNQHFNAFTYTDNLQAEACGGLTTSEQYQLIQRDCGEAKIKRRYRVTDLSDNISNWVEQNIRIQYKADWSFTLPADWKGTCSDQGTASGIIIDNGACDLLGHETTNKLIEVPEEGYYKIERTYHIINWCTYQAGQEPIEIARKERANGFVSKDRIISSVGNEDQGYFTYVQVLKIRDSDAPAVRITDPMPCFDSSELESVPYKSEDQTANSATYKCKRTKIWTANATDCTGQGEVTWKRELTWKGYLRDANGNIVITSNSNFISYNVASNSTYYVEFHVYDRNGNLGEARGETINFRDCTKPIPSPVNGVVIEILETGKNQVWATDLERGSYDNCTNQTKLDLRIYHKDLGVAPTDLASVQALPRVLTLDCSKLDTQFVQLYAIDEGGNWDYQPTYLVVQDKVGACKN